MLDSTRNLATLPLDEQLEVLTSALGQGDDPRALLDACATVRDHAPLSWLARRLLERGWLASPDERTWLAEFLLAQPETAVDRVLKSLIGDGTFNAISGPQLRDTLLAMLRRVTVDRVSVMCLVDRALKHNFADDRDAHVEAVAQGCGAALAEGNTAEVTIDKLAQVSAPGIAMLRERAAGHSAQTAEFLEQALDTLALRTLEVLGQAPKAVSQANAEELLSKRVYTDPGHFLVELLQNAEDSGAVTFRLDFSHDRIVLWHDGTPFDTRDVVGVTSIGQTTKRKQQIGFFGVGFKSVYEVTDRPQIYSDLYRFEIADVSIPKALSARPDSVPADGTVLVLPLRDPSDAERSPAALFAKARDLDAIVLFTLRRIDVIELSLRNADGTTTVHAVHELPPDERGISRIRQQPEGWLRGYAVHDAEHVYHGGGRAPGRADRTRVMVGLRVDEHGVPRALEDDTPTIYSYLPTEEHSGLRFFVQGHFDVPVDRERVTQDSRWNEWILSKVAPGLAALAQSLTADLSAEQQQAVALGLLKVLPLAAELGSPIFRRIVLGLRSAFAEIPIVPGEDGALHPPAQTVVADEALAALFEGEPINTTEGTRALAHRSLDERAIEMVSTLGAKPLVGRSFIDLLERDLSVVVDGSRSEDPQAPIFARSPTPARLAACYEVLDEALTGRAAGGPRRPADPRNLARLRALPLVLSDAGTLHRATRSIVRAEPALREIYAGLRAFVHPEHDAAVDPEDPSRVAASAFVDRLGVRQLQVRQLVDDLQASLGDGPLTTLDPQTFPGNPQRLHAAMVLLADAPVHIQRRAAALPLFVAQDGHYYRAAQGPTDRGGVLLVESSTITPHLLAYYGATRPVYLPAEGAEGDPGLAVLRSARIATLSLDTLIAELRERTEPLSADDWDRLHALLEAVRDELPARARRLLAELPIWPDTRGRCRPLSGEDAVRLPMSEQIAALLPDVPFVHPAVLARGHTVDMGGETIGLDALVDSFDPSAVPPLRIEPTPHSATAALEILCAHKNAIHPRLRARLGTVPMFVDDTDVPRALEALSLAEDPALRSVYGNWAQRHFVDPQSLTRSAITELELDARLERVDIATLAVDLGRQHDTLNGQALGGSGLPLVVNAEHLRLLLGYCAQQATAMARTVVMRLIHTAIFPDTHGRLGPLGEASQKRDSGCVYACEPSLRKLFEAMGTRVLAPWAEQLVAPLLETAGREPLEIIALVEQLTPLTTVAPAQTKAAVQSRQHLTTLHAALVEAAPTLAHRFGTKPRENAPPSSPVLGNLAIWPTRTGAVITAHEAIDSEALRALLPPHSPARGELEAVTPNDDAAPLLRALAPLVLPASPQAFAARLVELGARDGQPMAAQPPALRDLGRVAQLFVFIGPDHSPRPLVAADGRLRLSPLHRAAPDTIDLLHDTPLAATIVHPAVAAQLPTTSTLAPLEPAAVLDALVAGHEQPGPMDEHPVLGNDTRRQRFYAWVVAHESALFTDPDARARLRSLPLWPTDRGTIRPADQLVVDPDLPALDVDWTPHPELPAETLSLLVRHLGIGRPPVEDLVADHLAPAYRAAAARGDGPGAARLLEYLARAVATSSAEEICGWLSVDGTVLVESADERFVPAQTLLLPPDALASAVAAVFGSSHPPPHSRLPRSTHALLRAVGVGEVPSREWVAEVMRNGITSTAAATGLALLVAHLHRADPAETIAALPLRDAAWILDGQGVIRRPSELFAWTTDLHALVGDSPALYPATEITRALGEPLHDALGLRTVRDVRLPEVVAHIDASAEASLPLPFRVYQWLERGLADGWLDGAALHQALATRRWVCTDDGEYHSHERVLGVRALEDFGTRRGYWERGASQCPALCRVFGIAAAITPAVRMAFIAEVTDDANKKGDRTLLASEPALPRMLLRAYADLGRQEQPPLPTHLLARQCGGDEAGALRLVGRDDPLLLRSDSPALESLFADAGVFYVAAPGPRDDRADIDTYYEHAQVARLRETYEVRVADAGHDETARHASGIATLRITLRGLLATLPRVRLQRTHLRADAWVYDERLTPLSRTGTITAQSGLHVDYVLPGVGHARTRATAVYDPASAALLVDSAVLLDPDAHITGLAQGLIACLYDGPDEEQLVDIVEILLRLRTRERMTAYLDQRFFPTIDEPEVDASGRLAARVGELFDYGLDRRLIARFPELRERPLERWRDPNLLAALPEGDDEHAVRTVVARMLTALELDAASQSLIEALALLLSAPSLSDIPAGLLAPHAQPEPALPQDLGPREPSASAESPQSSNTHDPTQGSADAPSLDELEARLAQLVENTGRAADEGDTPSEGHVPWTQFINPTDSAPLRDEHGPLFSDIGEPTTSDASATAPAPAQSGFWQRLARRLGFAEEHTIEQSRPAWSVPGANVLSPADLVGPQLWVRSGALREIATQRIPMGLLHQPRVLPAPHRYAVHTIGVAFDPATQAWLPRPLPALTATRRGEQTGHSVAFAGRLSPGRSIIPVPLYSQLARIEVVDGDPSLVRPQGRQPAGGLVVEVLGPAEVGVRYEVALRRPPALSEAPAKQWELGRPTLPREALPTPVQTWIERNASRDCGAWEQARRAEAFVQRHYVYDLDFRERPAVQRAVRELEPGIGNHHLALLHASGQGPVLGRGVCYELNVMVVELCRHLGLPAFVATGWMLDEGYAARPDHLFALVVVPTVAGPCLLPLDASTGPGGHIRPLAGAEPPAVGLKPPVRAPIPEPGGGWGGSVLAGPQREAAIEDHVQQIHREVRAQLEHEREAMRRVIRIADAAAGREEDPSRTGSDDVRALRRIALAAVGHADRLTAMLAVIRGDFESSAEVPEVVAALVRDGLAKVESYPSYRVRAADER